MTKKILFIIIVSYIFPQYSSSPNYSIANHLYISLNFQLGYQKEQGVCFSSHFTLGMIDLIGLALNNSNYSNPFNGKVSTLPQPGIINPGVTIGTKSSWGGYRSTYYEFQNSFIVGGFGFGKETIINTYDNSSYSKKRRKLWISAPYGIQIDWQVDDKLSMGNSNYPNKSSISLLLSLPVPFAIFNSYSKPAPRETN